MFPRANVASGSGKQHFPIVFGAYAVIGGIVTLIGWFGGYPLLTDWVASGISMFANTALAATCAGSGLILATLNRGWSAAMVAVCGAVVALLGGLILIQHAWGVNLGIDTFLIEPTWGHKAASAPGRMGMPASTSFVLIGLALIALASGRQGARRFVPAIGISVCAIATLGLMGYLSGADPLFAVAKYTGIAAQTGSFLLAIGLGLIASAPNLDPMRTLNENSAAGMLARRTLPFIIGLPLVLAWLRIHGQSAGWFDAAMGTSLLALTLVAVFCGLLWWWVATVAEHEKALEDAQQKLLQHTVELEAIVAERTAKLKETVNDLQSFSYSIAHDMRAPLRAMGTFAQLLMEDLPANAPPEAKDYCQRIVVGAGRLDNLIKDALNYTKAALQESPLQEVDLSKLVRGLLDTYPNLHLENADIQIENSLPVVLGNESLLTQCFSNLLGNAVKFVPPGVHPKVRLSCESRDGFARISVQDNGIGIPAHAQTRLFVMFQKLDNEYEGTGIGLAIVRKVVERMGGKVGVESEPDQGSRFWVDLRVAAKKEGV